MQKTRIAVVDNHNLVRVAFSAIIDEHPEFAVSLQSADGSELVRAIRDLPSGERPDIVLSDMNMPGMDGYEMTLWLKKRFPGIGIIILSLRDDELALVRLIKAGISGYLIKNAEPEELFAALRTVAGGGTYFKLRDQSMLTLNIEVSPAVDAWYSLGSTEKEFVRLCATDIEVREIFRKMGVGVGGQELLARKVYAKFGVRSRIGLILVLAKHKLLDKIS